MSTPELFNKEILHKNSFLAMLSTFLGGMVIHMYALVNVLQNYDNIAILPSGYGTGVQSGRWLLHILGGVARRLDMDANLPWFNGLMGIVLLSLSTYLLIELFQVRTRSLAIAFGILHASFPSFVSLMCFRYTVVYYGIALLLAVFSVYVMVRMTRLPPVLRVLIAAGLLSFSLGIYQAYFPVSAALFVLHLLKRVLDNEKRWQEIVREGLCCMCSLMLGLLLYFMLVKVSLLVFHADLLSYKGIDRMGQISLSEFPLLFWRAFVGFFQIPLFNTYYMAPKVYLRIALLILDAMTFYLVIYAAIHNRLSRYHLALALALSAVFPIGVNLIAVMCPKAVIYSLMAHGCIVMFLAPLVILESCHSGGSVRSDWSSYHHKVVMVCLCLMILGYAYSADSTYTAMYYFTRQTENAANSIVTQIRMTKGFKSTMKWAFLGEVADSHLTGNPWSNVSVHEGSFDCVRLMNAYSWSYWIQNYIGVRYDKVTEETLDKLSGSPVVIGMPCWPNEGSVRIVEDTVVVKFGPHKD